MPQCTYPLTGVGCVSRVSTDCGVFDVGTDCVLIRETYGVNAYELAERLGIPPPSVPRHHPAESAVAQGAFLPMGSDVFA
ncbi:hypothetical protein ABZY05_42275 [Streptomyces canus]|uniref:hypothetical protein n=1 Tax=Streptomyces canus TaxID=58343 RepID=UPI0033BE0818